MEPQLARGVNPGGGYSRRCLPGDAKSTDRQKLLTDRNAYISYLEAQAQRADDAATEAEAAGAGLRLIQNRVEHMEKNWRDTSRALELVHETSARASDGSVRACRQELEGQFRALEGRVQRLEQLGTTADAEIARMRNEVSLSAHELSQHLDARVHTLWERLDEHARGLHSFADNGASLVIREAQATCVRLADDALGASEASQKKLEELSRQTEAGHKQLEDVTRRTNVALEVLRADVIGIRAEQARHAHASPAPILAEPAATPVGGSTASNDKQVLSSEIAEEVERRLSMRLGQQVLQLSEALRRVVQAQQCLVRSGSVPAVASTQVASAQNLATAASPSAVTARLPNGARNAGAPPEEGQRRAAIEDLYRELWELEENNGRAPSRSTSRPRRPRSTPRRLVHVAT